MGYKEPSITGVWIYGGFWLKKKGYATLYKRWIFLLLLYIGMAKLLCEVGFFLKLAELINVQEGINM